MEVSTPELYEPLTGTFATTGTFVGPGDGFYIRGGPNSPAVTLMNDGRVLFAAEPFSEIYDPVKQRFSAVGAMKTTCGPFYGLPNYIGGRTATLLTSGDVLVAGGGHEDCGRFADAERYVPDSGTFELVAPMTRRRVFHTATRLQDGTILIVGGESESGFSLITEATAEIYDPSVARFYLAGSMQKGREGHTATLLNDGRVLLAGGVFYQDVGIFLGSLDSADLYMPKAMPAPMPVFPINNVVTETSVRACKCRTFHPHDLSVLCATDSNGRIAATSGLVHAPQVQTGSREPRIRHRVFHYRRTRAGNSLLLADPRDHHAA